MLNIIKIWRSYDFNIVKFLIEQLLFDFTLFSRVLLMMLFDDDVLCAELNLK